MTTKGFKSKGLSAAASRQGILDAADAYIEAKKNDELPALVKAHGATMKSITCAKRFVRIKGHNIPAKLLLGMAAGMAPKHFNGAVTRIGPIFAREGFRLGCIVFTHLNKTIGRAAHPDFQDQAPGDVDGIYFASGSNCPGHIRGLAHVKQALGVAAPNVTAQSEQELYNLKGTGMPIFVDSGAFSEVEFNARHRCGKGKKKSKKCAAGQCIGDGNLPRPDLPEGAPYVVKPITEEDWQDILDLYGRLALVLGEQLYLVAPDKVGFQEDTLERLTRWREELLNLRTLGANIIVVAQRGPAMSQAQFDEKAQEAIGFDDYVRALPCKKNATDGEGIRSFVRARKPDHLHLLGLGLRSERAPEAAAIVQEENPETLLSYDSCVIKESMGKTNGRDNHPQEEKGGPRVLEQAKTLARALVEQGKTSITCIQELAIRLAWGGGQQSLV